MNVSMDLLFNLDIPLNYLDKLNGYYYIPQNRLADLKLGGFIYVVDKLVPIKTIKYCGILSSNKDCKMTFVKNDSVDISKFHVFYKPRKNRIQTAISLLTSIQ